MEHILLLLYSIGALLGFLVLILVLLISQQQSSILLRRYSLLLFLLLGLYLTELLEIYGMISHLKGLNSSSNFSIIIYKLMEASICFVLPVIFFRIINRSSLIWSRLLPAVSSLTIVIPVSISMLTELEWPLQLSEILFTFWMILNIALLFIRRKEIIQKNVQKYVNWAVPILLLFIPFLLLDILFPFWLQKKVYSNVSFALFFFYTLWNALHLIELKQLQNTKQENTLHQIPHEFIEAHGITERELEIIKNIICGKTSKEVAYDLNISPKTVKNHIYNIYKKTGIQSRVELLWMLQKGT